MEIIGVTGSSGSGKTTVAHILKEKYHAKIIDADQVVKEMSVPGTEYMNQIRNKLGKEFFLEDGNLNKKKLAERIYYDKDALQRLNDLTFTYIVDEIKKRVLETEKTVSFIVIDAPLLIESGLQKLCDHVVAVIAEKEIKIERICQRDGLDRKTAEDRLNIQKSDSFYIKQSDFVIYNNTEEIIENEIEKIIKEISK